MKTRAAVAFAARKPLEIVEVELDGPKAGEVLVEVKATGICHTDYYTLSGADPEGLFPCILGHEGAGVVVDVGAGEPHEVLERFDAADLRVVVTTPDLTSATDAYALLAGCAHRELLRGGAALGRLPSRIARAAGGRGAARGGTERSWVSLCPPMAPIPQTRRGADRRSDL